MVRRWTVAVAALVFAGPLLAGCSGSDKPPSAASAGPTPLSRLDVGAIRPARMEFCDRVPVAAVRRALGGEPQDKEAWRNGDPAPLDGDTGDVTHELGCSWTRSPGAAARAWLFARPVAPDFATALVQEAGQRQGCRAESAPTFGSPAVLQTCTLTGGVQRVRRAGLFGDTWLTCEVAGPATSGLEARTDAWCATVVSVVDAG